MKLSILTLFLFGQILSLQASENYEILGRYKTDNDDGLLSKLVNPVFDHIDDTDRLMKALDLEVDIPIGKYFSLSGEYIERINNKLGPVTNNEIGPQDLAQFNLVNGFVGKIKAGFSLDDIFSSEVQGGHFFGVSKGVFPYNSNHLPHPKMSAVEYCEGIKQKYAGILNEENKDEILRVHCGSDHRQNVSKIYGKFLDVVSWPVKKAMQFFADTEKMKIRADGPLDSTSLYSSYGIPLDLNIFSPENNFLNEGDIIQSTAFYQWQPWKLSIPTDINILSPSHGKDMRLIRDTRIQKQKNGWVEVSVIDEYFNGKKTTFTKIRPRVLYIFKYTLADWNDGKYKKTAVIRNYKINTTSEKGRSFLSEVLVKGFLPSMESSNFLGEAQEIDDVLVIDEPKYIDGAYSKYRFFARLPFLFKRDKRSTVRTEQVTDDKGTNTHNVVSHHSRKKKYLKFLFLKKSDQVSNCEFRTNVTTERKYALSLNCFYSKTRADEDIVQDVYDSIEMLFDKGLPASYMKKLDQIKGREHKDLKFVSQISIDHEKLIEAFESNDKRSVTYELFRMMFGEKAEKYITNWDKRGFDRALRDLIRGRNAIRNYSHHYSKYFPHNDRECKLAKAQGSIQVYKGIFPFYKSECYDLMSKVLPSVGEAFESIKKADDVYEKLAYLQDAFPNMNMIHILQNLMIRLVGGIDNVAYGLSVDTKSIPEEIELVTQGLTEVDFHRAEPNVMDVKEIRDNDKRIAYATIKKAKGDNSKLYLDIYTKYRVGAGIKAHVDLKETRFIKDKEMEFYASSLDQSGMKTLLSLPGDTTNDYLENLSAKYLYSNIELDIPKLKRGERYTILLKLKNAQGEWVSEEIRFRFKWK